MEQVIDIWIKESGFKADGRAAKKLAQYSVMIHEENEKHNLTGLKTVEDIQKTLIIKSMEPLAGFSVPRGTRFADVGTGSGVPGVVLGICFPDFEGVLIESNGKKTEFITRVISELGIKNITVKNGRVEDFGLSKQYRESFDWCFTRAFGPIYYSVEFGMPLLKKNGMLYVYSNLLTSKISKAMIQHAERSGGVLLEAKDHSAYGISDEGLLFKRINPIPKDYPRKFPIVKRESAKVPEVDE